MIHIQIIFLCLIYDLAKIMTSKIYKMPSNCDKCKDKTWQMFCEICRFQLQDSFICFDFINIKNIYDLMCIIFNNPDLYIACNMCKSNKHIAPFRFGRDKSRLCVYLNRYKCYHT